MEGHRHVGTQRAATAVALDVAGPRLVQFTSSARRMRALPSSATTSMAPSIGVWPATMRQRSLVACSPTTSAPTFATTSSSGGDGGTSDNDGVAAWKHSLAGAIAGICGLASSYPLDTVKVRVQTRPGEYKGMMDCFVTMTKQEGVMSFYRGMSAPVLGYGAINAVVFSVYGTASEFLKARTPHRPADRQLDTGELWVAGAAVGIANTFIRTPVERIKSVMQSRKNPDGTKVYRNSWVCLRDTVRSEGLLSPFNGFQTTLLREVAQYGVYFMSYETVKATLAGPGESPNNLPPLKMLLAGGLAGAIQWLPPIYCIDVIKSRMQVAPPGTYRSSLHCVRTAYANEGAMVFLRGLLPTLARSFPLHAGVLTSYEMMMRFLRDDQDDVGFESR